MNMKTYVKVAVLSSVLLLGLNTPVCAQWPTLDGTAVGEAVSGVQTKISSVQQQILSSSTLQKVMTAIGDPKAALSKFAGDEAEKQLKKAEKMKKNAEKIQKMKEKIDKAKKTYEEKKQKYEEYKEKVAKAKEKYNEYKEKYDEAKEFVNDAKDMASAASALAGQAMADAKDMASSAGSIAGDAISNAKGQISSKAGALAGNSNLSSIAGSALNKVSTGSALSNVSSVASQETPATKIGNQAVISGGATALQTGGANQTVSMGRSITPKTGEMRQAVDVSGAVASKAGELKQVVDTGRTATLNTGGTSQAVNANEALVQKVGDAKISTENQTVVGRRPFGTEALLKKETALDKTPVLNNLSEEKVLDTENAVQEEGIVENVGSEMVPVLNQGEAVADNIKQIAREKGAMEASDAIKSTVRKAMKENDIETLDAVSKLQKSDIMVSDSKKYEETPSIGRKAFSKPAELKAPEIKASPVKAVEEVQKTVSAPLASTIQKVDKASAKPATGLSGLLGGTKVQEMTPTAVKPEMNMNKIDLKASPISTLQKNSYWQEEKSLQNVKLSYAETLRFGDAANECSDYSYSIQNADDGEIIILPEELAKKCCIKAEQLKDYQVIKDCLAKFALEMNGRLSPIKAESDGSEDEATAMDASIAQEAKAQYSGIQAELSKDNLVAAMDDLDTSLSYMDKVFTPAFEEITKQQGDGATARDNKSALALTTKNIAYLLNQIRKIEATSLITESFEKLGRVQDETLNESREIGLPAEQVETEATVTIDEGNYPIIPENLAVKCKIKVSEGVETFKDCLSQVVSDLYATDNEDVKVAQAFMDNIKYQELLDVISKGLEQKVRVAEYDEKLEALQEENEDATDERGNDMANASVDAENNAVWTDFLRLQASSIAHTALNSLDGLTPVVASGENKG